MPGTLDQEARFAAVEQFGHHLMGAIGRALPAPPVPLVASLFAARPEGRFTEESLTAGMAELTGRLRAAGAHLQLPGEAKEAHSGWACVGWSSAAWSRNRLRALRSRRAKRSSSPTIYYANSIAHLTGYRPIETEVEEKSATRAG